MLGSSMMLVCDRRWNCSSLWRSRPRFESYIWLRVSRSKSSRRLRRFCGLAEDEDERRCFLFFFTSLFVIAMHAWLS